MMQIVWVGADDFDPVAMRVDHDRAGNHLVFVVEHRMGFGIHVVTVTAVWVNSCVAIPTQFEFRLYTIGDITVNRHKYKNMFK